MLKIKDIKNYLKEMLSIRNGHFGKKIIFFITGFLLIFNVFTIQMVSAMEEGGRLSFSDLNINDRIQIQNNSDEWITFRIANLNARMVFKGSDGEENIGSARWQERVDDVWIRAVNIGEDYANNYLLVESSKLLSHQEVSVWDLNDWRRKTGSPYWTSTFGDPNAWYVGSSGNLLYVSRSNIYGIRPAVYLKSDLIVLDGNGTSENPYKLVDNIPPTITVAQPNENDYFIY